MRRGSFFIAFLLGACTTAAVQSTASAPAEPQPPVATESQRSAVVRLDTAERRESPDGTGNITILARGNNAFLGKLELASGAAVPEHRDATEEYIHVVQGGGAMHIDGERIEIGPGDTVYMPANALVSFENGDTPLVAIQVFAGPEPADKYDRWAPIE